MSTQSTFAKYVASGAAMRAANAAVQAAVARQIAAGLMVDGSPKKEATSAEKKALDGVPESERCMNQSPKMQQEEGG